MLSDNMGDYSTSGTFRMYWLHSLFNYFFLKNSALLYS